MRVHGGTWTRVAALLLVCGTLAACGPTAHPTLAELRAVPGTGSIYPGSTVTLENAQESNWNLMAKNGAIIVRNACTSDEPEGVLGWFRRHLQGLGWTESPGLWVVRDGPDGQGEFDWARGDQQFQLFLGKRGAPPGGQPTTTCTTPYKTVAT